MLPPIPTTLTFLKSIALFFNHFPNSSQTSSLTNPFINLTPPILKDLDLKNQNIALIVGSEETGLSKEIQKKLDLIVDISMTDNMESLNASVATAIAMHEIFIKK